MTVETCDVATEQEPMSGIAGWFLVRRSQTDATTAVAGPSGRKEAPPMGINAGIFTWWGLGFGGFKNARAAKQTGACD